MAAIVNNGVDFSDAFHMTLSGLDPEQRASTMLKMAELMPPSARAALLGDAMIQLGDPSWEAVKTTLDARERRPKVVEALVEEGRQTQTVRLGDLVVGTQVTITMGTSAGKPFPPLPTGMQPVGIGAYDAGAMQLEVLGGSEFVTLQPVSFITPKSQQQRYDYKENTVVRLRSGHVRKESPTNVRYGDPLMIAQESEQWQTVYSLNLQRPKDYDTPENIVKVMAVQLDATTVFTR